MKRRVGWLEEGMNPVDFQKPDRFGGPPKTRDDDQESPPGNGGNSQTTKPRKRKDPASGSGFHD
jgi:hypothetical protein